MCSISIFRSSVTPLHHDHHSLFFIIIIIHHHFHHHVGLFIIIMIIIIMIIIAVIITQLRHSDRVKLVGNNFLQGIYECRAKGIISFLLIDCNVLFQVQV